MVCLSGKKTPLFCGFFIALCFQIDTVPPMDNFSITDREVASLLMQINAIKLRVETPFTWASGLKAPIYCDNRLALSHPHVRNAVADGLTELVGTHYPDVRCIAGVATGAIAMGVLVAQRLGLPFVYVRSAPKAHGLGSQVEGHAEKGNPTVIIEDLVSTAKSSVAAFHALKDHGLDILGMAAIFTYDLEVAKHTLAKAGCSLVTLSNYHALLEVAREKAIISDLQMQVLQAWRNDPIKWSSVHQNTQNP